MNIRIAETLIDAYGFGYWPDVLAMFADDLGEAANLDSILTRNVPKDELRIIRDTISELYTGRNKLVDLRRRKELGEI